MGASPKEVDIGLVGIPFDLGINYRSGDRSPCRTCQRFVLTKKYAADGEALVQLELELCTDAA